MMRLLCRWCECCCQWSCVTAVGICKEVWLQEGCGYGASTKSSVFSFIEVKLMEKS